MYKQLRVYQATLRRRTGERFVGANPTRHARSVPGTKMLVTGVGKTLIGAVTAARYWFLNRLRLETLGLTLADVCSNLGKGDKKRVPQTVTLIEGVIRAACSSVNPGLPFLIPP